MDAIHPHALAIILLAAERAASVWQAAAEPPEDFPIVFVVNERPEAKKEAAAR